MVNLKAAPFCLSDEDIAWVEKTWESMSLKEKVGQLFISLNLRRDIAHIRKMTQEYHVGGIRWQGGTLEEVYEQNRTFQETSRIPVLIAANCEAGGNGAVGEGTLVAMPAACGAAAGTRAAWDMGYVSGVEAKAIGCNISFSPVADLLLNWRNTIVNLRAFGKETDRVIELCKAYMDGIRENGIACCAKHFPGDGSEERDQHLVMGCNDLDCDTWMATYGKVYRELIEYGLEAVMVGHICQPAWTRHFSPDTRDEDILPASMCPELLQGLLRNELGFNGLVITDASHMAGMTAALPRKEQVPRAIAAGCDMFLFFNDPEEDIQFMLDGLENGILTEERLSDAVHRILGMKAHLGLHRLPFPDKALLRNVGCADHHLLAERAADMAVTLVKDTQHLLPIDPAVRKKAYLIFAQSAPVSNLDGTDKAKVIVIDELQKAGFDVTAAEDYYEMEMAHPSPFNRFRMMETPRLDDFRAKYDVVFVFTNMKGYAQGNNVRLQWSASHSFEMPWYVKEVPTVFVSLSYTNQLYDLPMAKTYINAYSATREYIHATVSKIVGQSAFAGNYDDNVWCGRWDTRC